MLLNKSHFVHIGAIIFAVNLNKIKGALSTSKKIQFLYIYQKIFQYFKDFLLFILLTVSQSTRGTRSACTSPITETSNNALSERLSENNNRERPQSRVHYDPSERHHMRTQPQYPSRGNDDHRTDRPRATAIKPSFSDLR